MYKDYNKTQLTLPIETSVLIPTNDIHDMYRTHSFFW
ncbi:transposase [Staphylococcus sp. HMSC062B11]|nr:transposase [Staphylococcus sp. HMSC062B11]